MLECASQLSYPFLIFPSLGQTLPIKNVSNFPFKTLLVGINSQVLFRHSNTCHIRQWQKSNRQTDVIGDSCWNIATGKDICSIWKLRGVRSKIILVDLTAASLWLSVTSRLNGILTMLVRKMWKNACFIGSCKLSHNRALFIVQRLFFTCGCKNMRRAPFN